MLFDLIRNTLRANHYSNKIKEVYFNCINNDIRLNKYFRRKIRWIVFLNRGLTMRNILMEMTEIRRKIKFYIEYSVQAAMHTMRNFGGITNSYMLKMEIQ